MSGLPGAGPLVGRSRSEVPGFSPDPHPVAAALPGQGGEGVDEPPADAPAARRRIDRELVEEHLGALVGVGRLDAGHEAAERLYQRMEFKRHRRVRWVRMLDR